MSEDEFNELKIKFSMSIGYYGANRGDEEFLKDYVDFETWSDMTESEKEEMISEFTNDWSLNYLDLNGWVE